MKILMLSHEHKNHSVGGIGTHCSLLVSELKKSGIIVFHFVYNDKLGYVYHNEDFIEDEFNLLQGLISTVEKEIGKPTLIHCHDRKLGHIALFLKEYFNAPLVTTVHTSDHYRSIFNDKEKQIREAQREELIRSSDGVIFISKFLSDFYQQKVQHQTTISTYIYNGINLFDGVENIFHDLNEILYVGRLDKDKGVDILIEGFSNFINHAGIKDVKLNIVGEGRETNSLIKKCHELSIQNNVVFHGVVTKDDLKLIYLNNGIVVVPSVFDTCPYALLDALNYKRLVIASDVGGIPEIIQNKRNGILFRSDSASDLASKFNDLRLDSELRLSITSSLAQWPDKRFMQHFIVEDVIQFYYEALKK